MSKTVNIRISKCCDGMELKFSSKKFIEDSKSAPLTNEKGG